jgi:DNA polymerase IV
MPSTWPAIIAHADMDAFYAAVEQHDDPSLRGKPLLVGPRSQRGVVLTASYEARPFGVGSAMPMAEARRRCPQAIIVPPRFERYTQVSAIIMKIFDTFSPKVEPLSLDEAFIDMTGSTDLFGSPLQMGRKIKNAVRDATGLTVTVGMASTKHVAKIASAYQKPDGLTVVEHDQTRAWLAPLPVARIWGVGPKMQERLNQLGLLTIGDITRLDPDHLTKRLGRQGERLYRLACGEDPRPVVSQRWERSIGSERTLEFDVRTMREIEVHLRQAADRVSARLRQRKYLAGGVRVKLKTTAFALLSRQIVLDPPTDLGEVLYINACKLAQPLLPEGPFRLVGLATYDLGKQGESRQTDLFTEPPRQSVLETTIDAVSHRFGRHAIRRARDLGKSGTVMGTAPTLDFRQTGDEDQALDAPRDWSESEDPGDELQD